MRVKPAKADVLIPYEGTLTMLDLEGADVPDNQYWRRRLRDGDVVPVEAPAPKPAEHLPTHAHADAARPVVHGRRGGPE